MADNINRFNGKHSFVTKIEPAWHRKGTILDHAFTAEEAIEHANMGYIVAKAPLYAKFSNDKNDPNRGAEVPDYFATYRTDTRDIFGIVGSRYEIIQNTAAFGFFDSIVGEHKAVYETAGADRMTGTHEIALPADWLGDNVEVYLGFISEDAKAVSNSVYLGSVTIA